ncbi:AI-2 transport protein TqsA [Caloramator mitchellensis]|uniref:AI-2 transport protein TqsA n=1 Tax=Caloramator mitchellensis TaxID=908809 RepID=A0A0R3JWZ6_CALMK|nr:AI-2E family transporter [Caloramator mitchellensis]KRQ86877.1 AI-2 transport protein TqsA [Caloramator mitchellensis]
MKIALKPIVNIVYILVLLILMYVFIKYLKPVIIAAFLSYMLYPIVKYLKRKGLSQKIASISTVAIFIMLIALTLIYVIPMIIKEAADLMNNLNEITHELEKILIFLNDEQLPPYIKNIVNVTTVKLEEIISRNIKKTFDDIFNLLSNIPTYILIPIFMYYFLSDSEYFTKTLRAIIPFKLRDKALEMFRDYDKILGAFFKGQLILSIIITLSTLGILIIFKIKYAFIIAFLNGITNIIPYFGPLLGFIPALLSALTESTTKALYISVAFFVIQEIESGVIAPKILENKLGLHPVIVLIALLIGGKFFGSWGLILSVPVFAILKVTYNYLINNLY